MIKVQNLSKEFVLTRKLQKEFQTNNKKNIAVDDVSFTCHKGRIFSLLGPNGAGKTTIMRMLSTLVQPTSGEIEISGINVLKEPREARKKIGFLTGSSGLYARLSGLELVKYFADLYEVSPQLFEVRKEKLFTLLGIHEFQHQRIGKMSTGMKQKISLCRTMIHDPEVIVFDEPTSGLDVIAAESIIQLISDCKNSGKTVIFSSHIMSEVDLLCDDLAIIHKGKIIYNDSFEQFKSQMTTESLTKEFIHLIHQQELS
ncbi:MAG: ATP-binding cassette domain-containing protein [Flavobacteriia bacterium]|nr:ATP-binding cassette domain-containing protein [Flavobacteriia bacterium]